MTTDIFARAVAYAAKTWHMNRWDAELQPFKAVVSLWRGHVEQEERERVAHEQENTRQVRQIAGTSDTTEMSQ